MRLFLPFASVRQWHKGQVLYKIMVVFMYIHLFVALDVPASNCVSFFQKIQFTLLLEEQRAFKIHQMNITHPPFLRPYG